MSLNDGMTTKQRQRAELERLCAEYDGPINRQRSQRVVLCCETCNARRSISLVSYTAIATRHCFRCGSDQMKVQW
jgi:hypothetical protein